MGIIDAIGAFNDTKDIVRTIHDTISRDQELVINEFFIDRRLPITYAYEDPINPNLLPPDCSESNSPRWFAEQSHVIGPVGISEMHFSIFNKGKRPASIRGIGVKKHLIPDPHARGSMTFVPDGVSPKAPLRLRYCLDSNRNTMVEEDFSKCIDTYCQEDFFTHGRLEIDPGHTADLVVTLVAKENAYQCSLYLRAESAKIGAYILEPEGDTTVTVVPKALIPPDQRFTPSFRRSPPYVMPCRHYFVGDSPASGGCAPEGRNS